MILTACGGGGGGGDSTPPANASEVASDTQANNSPEIGRVLTDIRNIAYIDGESTGSDSQSDSIEFAVNAEVIDPDGFDDLKYIDITQVDDDWWWTLLGLPNDENRNECRIEQSDIFYCTFSSSIRPHSIKLTNWKVVAEDMAGNVTEKPFQFAGFDGETAAGNDIMYSPKYSGNRTNGLPAMESLSVERNGLSAEINEATETFRITFEATDTRIKNYDVVLWAFVEDELNQEAGRWVRAGYASANRTSIKSSPVVVGTQTTVDLSWSDISFRPGFRPLDIVGIRVTVTDEYIEVKPDYSWSHQVGLSEFVFFN